MRKAAKKIKSLIPRGVSLSKLDWLTDEQVDALRELGIESAQEVAALAEMEDTRDLLLDLLGVPQEQEEEFLQKLSKFTPKLPALHRAKFEEVVGPFTTGALPPPMSEFMAAARLSPYVTVKHPVALPQTIDYREEMPPIRDQGNRGTCVAFATTAVREYLEIRAGADPKHVDLSEQYLYWWCKEHDGIPPDSTPYGGTYLSVGFKGLEESGEPEERDWPYNPEPAHSDDMGRTGPDGQGPPPEGAVKAAKKYRTSRTITINPTSVDDIKTCLSDRKVVAFTIPVFNSWYRNPAVIRYGKISMPLPGEQPAGGHAMAIVGYVDDDRYPGGGYFIVRNSWANWASQSVLGQGYGTIPYKYFQLYGQTALSADRYSEADVYIRDNEEDTGSVPTEGTTWDSPDIWVRREADGGYEHQPLVAGRPNHIFVRVFNSGPAVAYDVVAHVFVAPSSPAIWPDRWIEIGQVEAEKVYPGEPFIGALSWTPPESTIYSILVKLESADDHVQHDWDVKWDNNIAQKSKVILEMPPGAQAKFRFSLFGVAEQDIHPTITIDRSALPEEAVLRVRFTTKAVTDANIAGAEPEGELSGWSAWFGVTEPKSTFGKILVRKKESSLVWVDLTMPKSASPGEEYDFVFDEQLEHLKPGRLSCHVKVIDPPTAHSGGWIEQSAGVKVKW